MEQRYWYGTSSLKRKIYWTSWCSTKEQRFWNNYIKLSSTWWLDQSILSVCTKKYPPSHSIKPFQTCCGVTWGKKVHQEGKYRLAAATVCSNSPASIHLRGSLTLYLASHRYERRLGKYLPCKKWTTRRLYYSVSIGQLNKWNRYKVFVQW